ncbi:MAG TPA: hypothetical protein VG693_01865, partial [Actinomycetes bacterium]|nr:hypothetical protein [Actinomycetes bacterium]
VVDHPKRGDRVNYDDEWGAFAVAYLLVNYRKALEVLRALRLPNCVIRRKRTPVPVESGHPFRSIPDAGGDGADDVQWVWGSVVTSLWQTIGASRFAGSMGLRDGREALVARTLVSERVACGPI